ncbi:MAG: TraR/DksA C4-type zinc finger protein [Microthrixaceae bacterium]
MPAKKATTSKAATSAKKAAPAKKAPAKAPAAKKAPAKKAPAKAPAAKKAPAKAATKSPATAKAPSKAPAKKAATAKAPSKAPAKRAATAKAPAKAPTKKAATAKAPAKKPPAKAPAKAPAKTAATAKAPAKAPAKTAPPVSPVRSVLGSLPRPGANPEPRLTTSPYDAKFLESQKAMLLDERATYSRQAEVLFEEAQSLTANREPGDVQFDEESGEGDTLAVARDQDLELAARARSTVEEIDAALERIADKTYGICAASGLAIPEERLKAIPWATERVEYKVGGFGRL